ncbi:carbohydrate ABC transporter permease [Vallitaleaceae bacterium 9-2]
MKKIMRIVAEIGFILLCMVYLSPVYIVVTNAFKNRAELYENMLALPHSLDFVYFVEAMEKMHIVQAFKNSFIVTSTSLFVIVILASMAAWMIVRVDNIVSKVLFMVFVATMLIPFQTLMMPLMQVMSSLSQKTGLPFINSLFGLVYMNLGFGASMAVFLYHGFIKAIPRSLEEAAVIDGCNKFRVFWKIVFPLLKPVTVTVMILDMIWIWNDFLLPSLVLSDKQLRTIPLSTASFFGQFTIQWNMAMAGLLLAILPIIVFYIAAQKYIIKGVASGAVK